MSKRLLSAAALAFVCAGAAACHHDVPPAKDANRAGSAAAPPAVAGPPGAMPVGSIKEDRGDVRYVNPAMQYTVRRDAGTAAPSTAAPSTR
jgi:hypothetical protein